MFAQKLLPSSLKTKVCGLTASLALSSSAVAQDATASLTVELPLSNSNLELCNFSIYPVSSGSLASVSSKPVAYSSVPGSAFELVQGRNNFDQSIQQKLEQILSGNHNIKNPQGFIAVFADLLTAENFNVPDCSRVEYASMLAEQLIDPHQHIFQGKRATCGATNIQLALARFEPELFVKFAVSAVISEKKSFELELNEQNSIIFKIPSDCFGPDNSRRSPASRIIQSCLMEQLNGDSLEYSNSRGYHYNKEGGNGRGVSMEAAANLLSQLRQKDTQIIQAPFDAQILSKLDAIKQLQPIFVSLNWRKLSAAEIVQRIELSGGSADNYVSKEGYVGHMLSFVGYESDYVLLSSSWHKNTHKKYDQLETIGPATTPAGEYDYQRNLIKMPRDEFLSRVKKIIY